MTDPNPLRSNALGWIAGVVLAVLLALVCGLGVTLVLILNRLLSISTAYAIGLGPGL